MKDFDEAVKLDPENASAYNDRGHVKFIKEDYDGAMKDFDEAAKSDPEYRYAYSNRGYLKFFIKKDYEGALEDYKKAREIALKNGCENKDIYLEKIKRMEKLEKLNKRDYDISEVNQGGIGDCYLLATLAKHPEWIKDSNCLRWNDDGSADVFLYDSEQQYDEEKKSLAYKTTSERKTYHITKEELYQSEFELTKYDGEKKKVYLGNEQDITLRAIEIGYLKACDFDCLQTEGGRISRVIEMLFGDEKYKDMSYMCRPGKYSQDDLKDVICASIPPGNVNVRESTQIAGKTIQKRHAYTFNGYDPETGLVSISNPWSNDLSSTEDDILIPWDDFKNMFEVELISETKKPYFIIPHDVPSPIF